MNIERMKKNLNVVIVWSHMDSVQALQKTPF